jgi:hypothetical protein
VVVKFMLKFEDEVGEGVGCPRGVVGADPLLAVALPPDEVGEGGYALGDWLSSRIIRICSSRCLFLEAFSDRARSRPGGGFASKLPMLGSFSFSARGAGVGWVCVICTWGVI